MAYREFREQRRNAEPVPEADITPNDPDWKLVPATTVKRLLPAASSKLDELIKHDPRFPKPGKLGRVRVWRLGDIRAYCELVATPQEDAQ